MDLYPLLLRLLGALWGLAFVILVGFTLEQYFPAQREPPLHNSLFKLRLLLAFTAIGIALAFGMAPLMRTTVRVMGDGESRLAFGASIWARAAQLLAGLLIFDFFYYWLHRLQHMWPVLWQEHKLHHADPALNVITAGLHHWLEVPLRTLFISIPMLIVANLSAAEFAAIGMVLNVWAGFKHANLRITLGPLTPFVVGPQLHRLHHSIEPEHRDKNFAAFFPIYDVLFGTYCRPKRSEWPATGLPTGEWPGSVREASMWPFLAWWEGIRPVASHSGRAPGAAADDPTD
jgi:sterol desaturase/sphingolipid hydroxylase (fatty acid hydroxylase superfamily)